jgi:GNAT superfamily N-acetyltransferase
VNEQRWEAVPYTPELAPAVLALHRRAWPEAEIGDERFFRWQYDENPAGPALSALARARNGGELIGQFGAIPLRLWVDGEERLGALGLNVVTDEAYRRQGIFAGLGRAADERMAHAGAAIAFAMPNESSFPGFVRRLGYTHAGDLPFLARPVNARRLAARRLPVPGAPALAALLSRPFFPPLPAVAEPVPGVAVERVEQIDAQFDDFWRRVRGRERIMVIRDASFLEWRFRRIPLRRYEILRARLEGQQAGYIVLRVADVLGMRAGLVVDFLVAPALGGVRVGHALLAEALACFAGEDIDLIATLMPSHALEYRLLRRAGFWPLPRAVLPQRFRLVARDGPAVRELRNWFFTLGDYDVV